MKILILNGTHDRETSTSAHRSTPMTATDIVHAITDTLNRKHSPRSSRLDNAPLDYINTIITPEGGEIEIDCDELQGLGITRVVVCPTMKSNRGRVLYDVDCLVQLVGEVLGRPVALEELQCCTYADPEFPS